MTEHNNPGTDYDVIIVGAGAAGASCAYHLAEAGVADVAVFEQDQPASKASGRAAGFITPDQFLSTGTHPDEHEYLTSFWERMAEDSAIELEYGDAYTFARNPESVSYLEELHKETRVNSELIYADELAQRVPDLVTDEIELAFVYQDGFSIDPYTATVTVLDEARDSGVALHTEAVDSIATHSLNRADVMTAENSYSASNVVIAAGAWSKKLAAQLGTTVPLKPRISQIAMLRPDEPVALPLVNDPDLLLYYRTEVNGEVLIGGGTGKEELDPASFQPVAREPFLQEVAKKAPKISAKLEQSKISGKWAGLCSATPDRHPLIGPIEGNDNIYLCCGFNGEGIMYSAVAGKLIADYVTGEESIFNTAAFSPSRFSAPMDDFEIRSAIEW